MENSSELIMRVRDPSTFNSIFPGLTHAWLELHFKDDPMYTLSLLCLKRISRVSRYPRWQQAFITFVVL